MVLSNSQAVTWSHLVHMVTDAAKTLVSKDGDTMEGNLNMGGNLVTGVATGADNTQAIPLSQVNQIPTDEIAKCVKRLETR